MNMSGLTVKFLPQINASRSTCEQKDEEIKWLLNCRILCSDQCLLVASSSFNLWPIINLKFFIKCHQLSVRGEIKITLQFCMLE